MHTIHLVPGSGDNFYCENCLRDNLLVRRLRRLGHDALLVPLYLPALLEDTGRDLADRVFFGGINVYLQQISPIFRHTPGLFDRLLDSPRLLARAARLAGMTDAATLGRTTLSMLQGRQGRQRKELDRLLDHLAARDRPHAVILSNALLLGLAPELRRRLDVPVLCLLQDEDEFLDLLEEPWRSRCWTALRENAAHVTAFVPVSRFYADRMTDRLALDPARVHVIPAGVDTASYAPAPTPPADPTIGFLSRQFPEKGLDLLVDAFLDLRTRPGLENLRLRAAGGALAPDRPYLDDLRRRIADADAADHAEFLPNLDGPARRDFLRSLTLLSVPERRGEACGLYVLEAWATAVPVVQPAHGVFPELLEPTGAGLLVPPDDLAALTDALAALLDDPELTAALGRKGLQAARQRFDVANTANAWIDLVQHLNAPADQSEDRHA